MAADGLSALVVAFAALLEQQSGAAIAVVTPRDSHAMASEEARLEICSKLGIEPCSLDQGAFQFSANSEGQAFVHEIAFPDGRVRNGCVVVLPDAADRRAGTDWMEAQYGIADRGAQRALRSFDDPDLQRVNALSQVASCARTEAVDDQVEAARELAFVALASELHAASPGFMMKKEGASGLGGAIGSEAVDLGASVGRRILVEHWKGELARQIEGRQNCRATVISSQEPVMGLSGGGRPSKELLGCLSDPAEWGVPRGTLVEVDDALLSSIAAEGDEDDLLERFSREASGLPSQADLQPLRDLVFVSTPFPGFSSIEDGLLYSWQVSGQIVGLR